MWGGEAVIPCSPERLEQRLPLRGRRGIGFPTGIPTEIRVHTGDQIGALVGARPIAVASNPTPKFCPHRSRNAC